LEIIYKDEWVKLIQGDCLEVMDKMIEEGIKVDMILADLPYGTTQNKWDSVIPLDKLWEKYEKIIKNNGCIALFSQTPFDKVLGSSNLKLLKYEWIWRKNKATGFLNSKKMPLKEHENILIFYKNLPTYNPQGLIKKEKPTINKGNRGKKEQGAGGTNYGKATKDAIQEYENYPKDILEFSVVMKPCHPTEKPIDLLGYLINTYTNEGEIVLDNTCGSGTTLVAARNLKRKCYGIELDKKYCEIAKQRLENQKIINSA
jgi:site-specific DNA-methyltransferase (adenine-specific)